MNNPSAQPNSSPTIPIDVVKDIYPLVLQLSIPEQVSNIEIFYFCLLIW